MKKIKILFFMSAILSLVVAVACSSDELIEGGNYGADAKNLGLSLEDAQKGFGGTYSSYMTEYSNNQSRAAGFEQNKIVVPQNYSPVWGKAVSAENSNIWSWDVPLLSDKDINFIQPAAESGYFWHAKIPQKLVVIKNKQTERINSYLLMVFPDADCAQANRGKDITNIYTHLGKNDKFTGFVVYCTVAGEVVCAVTYAKNSVKTIKMFDKTQSPYNRAYALAELFKNKGIYITIQSRSAIRDDEDAGDSDGEDGGGGGDTGGDWWVPFYKIWQTDGLVPIYGIENDIIGYKGYGHWEIIYYNMPPLPSINGNVNNNNNSGLNWDDYNNNNNNNNNNQNNNQNNNPNNNDNNNQNNNPNNNNNNWSFNINLGTNETHDNADIVHGGGGGSGYGSTVETRETCPICGEFNCQGHDDGGDPSPVDDITSEILRTTMQNLIENKENNQLIMALKQLISENKIIFTVDNNIIDGNKHISPAAVQITYSSNQIQSYNFKYNENINNSMWHYGALAIIAHELYHIWCSDKRFNNRVITHISNNDNDHNSMVNDPYFKSFVRDLVQRPFLPGETPADMDTLVDAIVYAFVGNQYFDALPESKRDAIREMWKIHRIYYIEIKK